MATTALKSSLVLARRAAAAAGTALDDRSPYEAAESVIRVIARLSPHHTCEEQVWDEIFQRLGERERGYVDAIRRTHHSIFYHQMQQLYEFAMAQVPGIARDEFCAAVGCDYTDHVLDGMIPSLLQTALARPGGFQAAMFQMICVHLGRHAGNIYDTSVEFTPRTMRFSIGYARPDLTRENLRQYDLDPEVCFRNSFHFIAGATQRFAGETVQDYNASAFRCGLAGMRGWMEFPIGEKDHFAFDKLIRTLMRYLREVEAGRLGVLRETELESSLVTRSRAMEQTWDRIRRASLSGEIVLLHGESGTGKSFIAQRIHELSLRRDKPFVEVALTSDVGSDNLVQSNLFGHEKGAFTGAAEQKVGLFTLADGGTIFLDEVGDATPELQAKLLRVVEQQRFRRLGGVRDLHVDVRIIAATHRDLAQLVREGRFREDLFYRLNVIPILLPPLRQRREDIPALAQFLLSRAARRSPGSHRRLPAELASRLGSYPWPGNIRELEHALKHALAMGGGDEMTAADFPPAVRSHLTGGDPATAQPPEPTAFDSLRGCLPVLDEAALRQAIRGSDPLAIVSSDHAEAFPAHIAHAKRAYLAALIDELHGDLSLIALFWDRGSEKTLRKQIRELGLFDRLVAARARSRTARGPREVSH
jgi:DNA-binding NtrC family response regulator